MSRDVTNHKLSTLSSGSLVKLAGDVIGRLIQRNWKRLVLAVPLVWLLIFFIVPFVIVLKISLAEGMIARPPFTPLFEWAEDLSFTISITFESFRFLVTDDLYYSSYLNSLLLAGKSTIICLLIGYPMAYGIARSRSDIRGILLLMVVLPFWTSFLLRIYAWMGLLNKNGIINGALLSMGIIDEPLNMMFTEGAIYVGIVYSYLPFMILPLYATMEKLDESLNEAAADLGGKPFTVFYTVTLPLTLPGIVAGSLLVFIPATGEYVIPALLGNYDTLMIGRVLFDEFFSNRDWPVASAVAVALLAFLVVPIMMYQHFQAKDGERS